MPKSHKYIDHANAANTMFCRLQVAPGSNLNGPQQAAEPQNGVFYRECAFVLCSQNVDSVHAVYDGDGKCASIGPF